MTKMEIFDRILKQDGYCGNFDGCQKCFGEYTFKVCYDNNYDNYDCHAIYKDNRIQIIKSFLKRLKYKNLIKIL
jgi:hypothetical protein